MERNVNKTDLRIIRTKRAIRNAFAELLSHKELSEITVKEIADAAYINRKTFYSYYKDVYQIVDEIENEIVQTFEDLLKRIDFRTDIKNPYHIFQSLTAVINGDLDFYGYLMRMDSRSGLAVKIIATLKDRIGASVSSQIKVASQTLDVMLEYAVSGMFAVYQSWFNSDRKRSLEEIAKEVSVITFSGFNGLIEPGIL